MCTRGNEGRKGSCFTKDETTSQFGSYSPSTLVLPLPQLSAPELSQVQPEAKYSQVQGTSSHTHTGEGLPPPPGGFVPPPKGPRAIPRVRNSLPPCPLSHWCTGFLLPSLWPLTGEAEDENAEKLAEVRGGKPLITEAVPSSCALIGA